MTDAAFTPPLVPPATEILSVREVARRARRNPLEIIPDLAYRQPMVSGRTVLRWHMVMDPGALRRVFLENVANYPKSEVTLRLLRPAVGQSLFTAHGPHWRWQRRAAAPAFQHRRTMALTGMMTEAAEAACVRFDAAESPLDMVEQMTEITFDVVCDALLSGRDSIDREGLIAALIRYIDTVGRVSLLDVLGLPRWVPRPALFRSIGAIREARRIMDGVISRRRAGAARPDLLGLILDAQDPETGRRMTDEEARDNLLTFVVAGHETTALTLAWALYLIASDPHTQERLVAEAGAVLSDGRAATGEDYEALPFTRQVVEETLRLYPPAAMLSRTAQAPDTLMDREVKRRDTVILPIYTLHRNELLWERPDVFDPDRFTPERVKARDRFAYLPFGAGPRICIGMNFALMEAVIVLATLVSRYRFEVPEGFTAKPVMTLTLRPATGLPLKVTRRA